MSEFEFLKRMYRRLHEFESFLAMEKAENKAKNRKESVNDSAVCAIKASITDYLKMRKVS